MTINRKLSIFFGILLHLGCTTDDESLFDPNAERIPHKIPLDVSFVDENLDQEARDLFARLRTITKNGIAFGQQESIGGGIGNFDPNSLESDFSIAAHDYAAVIGFDLEGIELRNPFGPDAELTNITKNYIINAHENGSIIVVSWHAVNPITRQNSFNRVAAVPQMLVNGSHRALFIHYLERLADFFKTLKDKNGNPIPLLFRPWHEMNGDFFYWGEGLRTAEEYKQLYSDTVHILRDNFNVHNLLYVYSPNAVSNSAEYLKNYPGDHYVDLLGIDIYDFGNGQFLNNALFNLNILEEIAISKNMLFALTETGLENLPQNNWWTQQLYKAIRSSAITYTMVWRNAKSTHFYVPYMGHNSTADFKDFVDKDLILLNRDINVTY